MAKGRSADKLRKLNMINMWLILGLLPAESLMEPAQLFTGTYFKGISCNHFSADEWPGFNDPNVFAASLMVEEPPA
jgi:hypothetical protein